MCFGFAFAAIIILSILLNVKVDACALNTEGSGTVHASVSITTLFEQPSSPDYVCYQKYGCFSGRFPFDDLPTPEDPDEIAPKFIKLELNATKNGIAPRQIENVTELNVDNLVVLTHGFTGSLDGTKEWSIPVAYDLIQREHSMNVLFIEWEKGAALHLHPPYTFMTVYSQPASNSRSIAAASVKFLQSHPDFNMTKSWCIGFSLGAHVCGFMSKYARQKWARLTAIDPAAPLFNKIDNPEARVDKSDAIFLDAIHTSKMGISFDVGHVDFYVNSLHNNEQQNTMQPGCEKELMPPGTPSWLMGEIKAYFACSHYRAPRLFAASINPPNNSKCVSTFKFCPCFDGDITNSTKLCASNETQLLGFGSYKYPDRTGPYCGRTTADPPYC